MNTQVVYPPARVIPVSMFDRNTQCFLIYGSELAELRTAAIWSCFLIGIPFLIASVFSTVKRIRASSTPVEK